MATILALVLWTADGGGLPGMKRSRQLWPLHCPATGRLPGAARHLEPLKALPQNCPAFALKKGACVTLIALALGTITGWALRTPAGRVISGTQSFRTGGRCEGGGMRFVRFRRWLCELKACAEPIGGVYFEEVRRHLGVDAAHAYGGFLATLTAWCEHHQIPYAGVPVGTIKKHATGKGNASKEEMIAAARARGHDPEDANAADALALLDWAPESTGT